MFIPTGYSLNEIVRNLWGSVVRPSRQDLYLLQNEYGLIKIGRSIDVAERIAKLRQSERCAIHFIVRFRRAGHHEEGAHINLHKYRLIGEWFSGSPDARAAIEREFCLDDVEWPVAYNAAAADRWVAHMRDVRTVRRLRRAIYRQTTLMRANGPHESEDVCIFMLLRHPLIDTVGEPEVRWNGEKLVRLYHDRRTGQMQPIPAYSHDLQAALTTWPEELRPTTWEGSAFECCIAGLTALRASISETPKLGCGSV